MRRTKLFTKTSKTAPSDETARNAQLLIQAGYIHKEMAGVYDFLPLGIIVLNKITQIIREEMNAIGGQEIEMATLQSSEPWQASGRWSDEVMDVWFRTKLASGSELGLAPTHEEPLTKLMKQHIVSYQDLPAYPYQFQTKFRNELRSKSGLMRGREFLMKDLYSFSLNEAEHQKFYDSSAEAYSKVFERLGIGETTYKTFASGGSFSKYSHEFQTVSEVGEDVIYIDEQKNIAVNEEVLNDEVLSELGLSRENLVEKKAVEVGNIFTLGTKYSDALELRYSDQSGSLQPVFMGSYGIGPSRLMGLLAEHFADDKGLIWPDSVAPFRVYLARLGEDDAVVKQADELYDRLTDNGATVLYDDRDARAGEKFADSDLLGIPYRVVVSAKTVESGRFELKGRQEQSAELVDYDDLAKVLDIKA